jgi:hypothetical protein
LTYLLTYMHARLKHVYTRVVNASHNLT